MAPDDSLEAAALRRKLAVQEAQRAYDRSCAETRLLEAAESERKLFVRLAFAEPQYEALREEHAYCGPYIDELEDIIETEKLTAQRHETVIKSLRSECATAKGRVKALEDELRTIGNTSQSSAAELVAERNRALSSYGELQIEHQLLEERLPALEENLTTVTTAKSELETTLKSLRAELASAKKEITASKKEEEKRRKSAEGDHVDQRRRVTELEEQLATLRHELEMEKRALERHQETAATKEEATKAREKELADLRTQFKKETTTREKAERELAHATDEWGAKLRSLESKLEALTKDESSKDNEKELSDLRAQLKKETKARKDVERELAKATEEWVAKHKVLESKLDPAAKEGASKSNDKELTDLRAQLKKEVKSREKAERELQSKTEELETKTKVLKKQIEKLKAANKGDDAKKRTSGVAGLTAPPDFERSVKKPRKSAAPKTSEFSVTPFLQRHAVVTMDTPDASIANAGGDAGDKTILMPSVIDSNEPTKLLLKERKRKAPAPLKEVAEEENAPTPAPAEAPSANEELEEEDSFMIPQPKPKKPTKARATKKKNVGLPPKPLLSSPAPPTPVVKPAPKPKPRKKKNPEASFVGGIRPTLFDEDDGTGRLNMNIGGDSQEPNGKAVPLLVPKLGAFGKEISPPKKRPAGISNIFRKK